MFQGPIRIEIPKTAVGGVFTAKAYRSGTPQAIAESSDADYETALHEVGTLLASNIEGDYSKNPRIITAPNSPEIL